MSLALSIHTVVPVLFGIAGLLGTIGKWTGACWPLVLAGSIVWAVLGG